MEQTGNSSPSDVPVQCVGYMDMAQIHEHWIKIHDALSRIPRFWDFYDPEWVHTRLAQNHLQAWAIGTKDVCDLIVITGIFVYPRMNVLRIMAASGAHVDTYMKKLLGVFDGFAKMHDCQRIETIVRPGLARKLMRKLPGLDYEFSVISRPVMGTVQ